MKLDPAKINSVADPYLVKIVLIDHFLVSIASFYTLAYFVVPTIVEQLIILRLSTTNSFKITNLKHIINSNKVLKVILATALCLAFYNVNIYLLFNYVNTHFNQVPPYIKNWIEPLKRDGPIGLFFNYSLFTFTWSYHASYMLLPLLLKIIREAVVWGADGIQQEVKARKLIGNKLEFLRQQINPHFLFNMLNNIHGLIQATNAPAASLLAKLSFLLRYALKGTKSEFVALSKEIQFIRDYVDMEATRHFQTDAISLSVTGTPEPFLIPPLLLVTFIENAFKHGLNATFEDGWVSISLHVNHEQQCLSFDISNNKPESADVSTSTGIGLLNARQRLELLFSPDSYRLDIIDQVDAYIVHLELPLKHNPVYEFASIN